MFFAFFFFFKITKKVKSILNIALVFDGYFLPDMDINSMLVLLKLPIGMKTTVQIGVLVILEKIVILDWNIGFLNVTFSMNFE